MLEAARNFLSLQPSYLRKCSAKRRNRHSCQFVTSYAEKFCLSPKDDFIKNTKQIDAPIFHYLTEEAYTDALHIGIQLKEEDILTFIRLTMLAGRRF